MANDIQINVPDYPPGKGVKNLERKEDKSSIRHVDKVITGKAITKKRSLGSKIAGLIFGEEMQEVKNYIIYDTVIPGIKETILESIEMIFFPGSGGRGRSRGRTTANRSSKGYSTIIDYGSFSKEPTKKRVDRAVNKFYEMDDIQFESIADADAVLAALREDIARYDEATLASYYELSGHTGDWTTCKYGWTNLDEVRRPRRVRGGFYVLDLPKPQLLG